MRRLLAVLCVPAFLASLAPAAPVPKHLLKNQEPVYYYPTTVGAKWVYDEPDGDHVLVVSKVEESKGVKVVTVEQVTKAGLVPNEQMAVSEAGLARLKCGGDPFDAPLVMLNAPFRAGTTWKTKAAGIEGTDTIGAMETVKVPAGTFAAVRVDADYTSGGQRMSYSAWYAPGVGLLKMIEGEKVIWLLKSFTPAK